MQFIARLSGKTISYERDSTFRVEQQFAKRRQFALFGTALTISEALAKFSRAKSPGVRVRLVAISRATGSKKTIKQE